MAGTRHETAIAWGTFAGCAGMLQWHSVVWWVDQVGGTGAGWSLVLEVLALWFWFRGGWYRAAGVVASAVVLAGPLHGTGAPLYYQWVSAGADRAAVANQLASVRDQIETQRVTLRGYRQRSEDRLGWRDVQERAAERLADLRERERRLLDRRAEHAGTEALADVGLVGLLQLTALVLFQVGTVTAVSYLSVRYRGVEPTPAPAEPTPAPAEPQPEPEPAASLTRGAANTDDKAVISRRLWDYMRRYQLSQPRVAELLSDDHKTIPRPEVTRLVNHDKYQERGDRLATSDTFARAARLLAQEEDG